MAGIAFMMILLLPAMSFAGCPNVPGIGSVQPDGSVYAGLTPDGNVPMYAQRCDIGMTWSGSACTGTRTTIKWSTAATIATGVTNADTGQANTIFLYPLSNADSPYTAAIDCHDLNEDGHTDWYLPAKNELNVMYSGAAAIGNFDTTSGSPYYWTSTEYSSLSAWLQGFSSGVQSQSNKNNALWVRCVRKDTSGGRAGGAKEYLYASHKYQYCDGTSWVDFPLNGTATGCTTEARWKWDSGLPDYKYSDGMICHKLACASSNTACAGGVQPQWSAAPQTRITASDGAPSDYFSAGSASANGGDAVAVSGTIALVGAARHSSGLGYEGAVYVYDITNPAAPVQKAEITASDKANGDYFGYSVAVYGNIAVIGAYNKTVSSTTGAGAVYIFDISNPAAPVQKAEISDPATVAANDHFGASVAVYGNIAVIGATGKLGTVTGQGEVYIFDITTPTAPVQKAAITVYVGWTGSSFFGNSVAVYGNKLVVGAYNQTYLLTGSCGALPAVGQVCADGSVFAGYDTPYFGFPMYTQRCDIGQTWNGSACTGTRTGIKWSTNNTILTSGTSQTGSAGNTTYLSGLSNTDSPYVAAQTCRNLNEDGHTDWFLPAYQELPILYANRAAIGNFDTTAMYWSSTETTSAAWAEEQSFSTGTETGQNKPNLYDVRCAREDASTWTNGAGAAYVYDITTPTAPVLKAPLYVPGTTSFGNSLSLVGNIAVIAADTSSVFPVGPCGASPTIGQVCSDGSVYAGVTNNTMGNAAMYTQRCDIGKTWNGSACASALLADGENATDILGEFGSPSVDTTPVYTKDRVNNGASRIGFDFEFPTDAQLSSSGVAIDAVNHRLFVADTFNNRVLVFALTGGNLVSSKTPVNVLGQTDFVTGGVFDDTAPTASKLSYPAGLAFDSVNNRLFVYDDCYERVLVFNTAGITDGMAASYELGQPSGAGAFTTSGSTTTQSGLRGCQYDYGADLKYDSANTRLYVADGGNNRVMVFNVAPGTIANGENADFELGQPAGGTAFTTATAATTQSGLNDPAGLAYDSANSLLYVSDAWNNRVMVFPTSSLANGENASGLLGQSSFTTNALATTQSGLYAPGGLDLDPTNHRLFVADYRNNRVMVFPTTLGPGPTTGLVGWWKLDDGAGTTAVDSSGLGHNGTLRKTTAYPAWIAGHVGSGALSFSGYDATGDYVDLGTPFSSTPTDWTFSVWFYPIVSAPGTTGISGLIVKDQTTVPCTASSDLRMTWQGFGAFPDNSITLTDDGPDPGCAGFYGPDTMADVGFSVPPGAWHLVTGVYKSANTVSSSMAVYVDGALVDTISPGVAIAQPTSASHFYLNKRDGHNYFQGYMDDVRIYNRALSAAEVAQLNNLGENASGVLGQQSFVESATGTGQPLTNRPAYATYDSANSQLYVVEKDNSRLSLWNTPATFPALSSPSQGGFDACAIGSNGTLWCWGDNFAGEGGFGNTIQYLAPAQVGTATNWTAVSQSDPSNPANSKGYAACGIAGGALYCWGDNWYGELGLGNTTPYKTPQQVGGLATWTAISQDSTDACGIAGGALWCWGSNTNGQDGVGDTAPHTSPLQVGTATNWTVISQGGFDGCGITADGKLWCWGLNNQGQDGQNNTTQYTTPQQVGALTTWTAVSQGQLDTCGIAGGALWCWGMNQFGELGLGNTTQYATPQQVGVLTTWTAISIMHDGSADAAACGIAAGKLYCWGQNTHGELGLGNTTSFTTPQQVGAATNWTSVSYTGNDTCGVAGGQLYCWGFNGYGEDGVGNTTQNTTPQAVTVGITGGNATDELGQYASLTSTATVDWNKGGLNNGTTALGLFNPSGVALDPVNHYLYVSECFNNRVLVYTLDTVNSIPAASGGHTASYVLGQPDLQHTPWGGSGTGGMGGAAMSCPRGLAVDAVNHRLFVADSVGNRVLVFSTSGIASGENAAYFLGEPDLNSYNSTGIATASLLLQPVGLAYDSVNQLLYVSDSANYRVVVFPTASLASGESATFELGQPSGANAFTTRAPATTASGMGVAASYGPEGLALDSGSNRLFVADTANNRVLVYTVPLAANGNSAIFELGQPSGGTAFTTNAAATTQSGMSLPAGLAYDPGGKRLFVADSYNSRVLVYNVATGTIANGENASSELGQPGGAGAFTTGAYALTRSGMWLNAYGNANTFSGLFYDPGSSRLFVADGYYNRVTVFNVLASSGIVWSTGATILTGQTNGDNGLFNTTYLSGLSNADSPYVAAQTCHNLNEDGHTDWYLPVWDELYGINGATGLYMGRVAIGNFDTTARYWGSDEDTINPANANYVDFSTGAYNVTTTKTNAYDVRCVRKDPGGDYSGAAYVYDLTTPASPVQDAQLATSDSANSDYFGSSVSLSGNIAVIGAYGKTINGHASQGAAYAFDLTTPTSPVQAGELTAADGAYNDLFGASAAVSGSTAVIGAYNKTINGNTSQGAAYVFGPSCANAACATNGTCTSTYPQAIVGSWKYAGNTSKVFITSTSYAGNIGSVAAANADCAARATAAGLPGTFKAWLAVTTGTDDPNTTFTHSTGPYRDVSGTTIANNWAGLTSGTLLAGIGKDEFGNAVTAGTNVWTNTSSNGTATSSGGGAGTNCSAWTIGTMLFSGNIGVTGSTTATWTASTGLACGISARLYCVQQDSFDYCDGTNWIPLGSCGTPAISFINQTGVALSTLTTSNIVQLPFSVNCDNAISISGTGSPQFQICSVSDPACASPVVAWTGAASTISPGQYIQLRLTSSASGNTANSATLTVGGVAQTAWNVTTDYPRKVFITSTAYKGNAFGANAAAWDATCAARATAAGLTGTWKAWVASSTSDTPNTRFTQAQNAPYQNMDGTVIASNWATLISGGCCSLTNGITRNESNVAVAANTHVWTNINSVGGVVVSGSTTTNCSAWTSAAGGQSAWYGLTGTATPSWSSSATDTCGTSNRLYCFQQ